MKKTLLPALLAALLLAGCGAEPAASSAPPDSVSPVYTDWSQLTPYEPPQALYREFVPFSGDALQARSDYGPLLPYVGAEAAPNGYYGGAGLPLYGLMTTEGQVVTDPVYSSVYYLSDYLKTPEQFFPFLVLIKSHPAVDGQYSDSGITVAAPDGSWVREWEAARQVMLVDDSHFCVLEMDGSVHVLGLDGETTIRFSGDVLRERSAPFNPEREGEDFCHFNLNWNHGICTLTVPEPAFNSEHLYALYLNLSDGSISTHPPARRPLEDSTANESGPKEPFTVPGYEYLEYVPDPVTGVTYYCGYRGDASGILDLLDEEGKLVLENCVDPYTYYPTVWAGLISAVEDGFYCYYDLQGNCIFRYPIRTNID